MKKGIVLEGGALRAIFSSGVCDALLEQDVMPDYLVGAVSYTHLRAHETG